VCAAPAPHGDQRQCRDTAAGAFVIADLPSLRSLYPAPGERALRKQPSALDRHALHFIALSPVAVLSTINVLGRQDASPRGGAPGFMLRPTCRRRAR
jgi:predicted pyridoxine 5'-phosphate oxidase superfamily flavin-nucleotide-binding protein